MTVQIISFSREMSDGQYVFSKFAAPRSLDEFDLNIIDFSDEKMWYSLNNYIGSYKTLCTQDLNSLNVMIQGSKKAKILFVLPQDIEFHEQTSSRQNGNGEMEPIYSSIRIKDILPAISESVYSIFPILRAWFETAYENTTTIVGDISYRAAFCFMISTDTLTFSSGSNKPTTIMALDRYYFTTLDIFASEEDLQNYVDCIFNPFQPQQEPAWMKDFLFNDDKEQNNVIETQNRIIDSAEEAIADANRKLENNRRYKSILYTNGNELVEVVFEILERILECDLSEFVDKKKEDFLIKKPAYTLVGEIKGISSNVRNENISQLENHFQKYRDKLQEEGIAENVHQVLIINPLRSKPLDEREPVHVDQIELAKRYGSLIVETSTLLKLFELFLQGKITTTKCKKLFTEKTGILCIQEFC